MQIILLLKTVVRGLRSLVAPWVVHSFSSVFVLSLCPYTVQMVLLLENIAWWAGLYFRSFLSPMKIGIVRCPFDCKFPIDDIVCQAAARLRGAVLKVCFVEKIVIECGYSWISVRIPSRWDTDIFRVSLQWYLSLTVVIRKSHCCDISVSLLWYWNYMRIEFPKSLGEIKTIRRDCVWNTRVYRPEAEEFQVEAGTFDIPKSIFLRLWAESDTLKA